MTPRATFVIGVYDNAAGYDYPVYRPTGLCIMSLQHFKDKVTKRVRASEFCHVCRYALVDQIDPSQHGIIERAYHPRYPGPPRI